MTDSTKTRRYLVKIDVSRLSDDGGPRSEWIRWCDSYDSECNPIPPDARVKPCGAHGDVDTWLVEASRPSVARRIVEKYAHAVGADAPVLSVEVSSAAVRG
jgi:hypothetical protein